MRKTLTGLAIFAFVTLCMLLLAEVVVRALFADNTVLFPRYHTDVQYGDFTVRRIRPDSHFTHTSVDGSWDFVTNSKGFRNEQEFSYEKPAGVIRILALGDSHTQGYEVRQDYTYAAALERYMNRHAGETEVINTGVSGFSTAEALVLLENEGWRYQPDAVVLGFFANDLEDNLKAGLYELNDDGELVVGRYSHIPGVRIQNFIYAIPGVQWLSENSYFYSVLFNATWEFFKLRLARQAGAGVVEYAIPQKDEYSSYEINLAAAMLRRMYEYCQDRGIELIIVDIPNKIGGGEVESSFPDALREVALENSDIFIDSRELLQPLAGVAELHVPNGHNHISELSHTLIAIAIGEQLVNTDRPLTTERVVGN